MPDVPDAVDVQTNFVRSFLSELRTMQPGELVSFDAATEIAEVRPLTASINGQGISVLVGVHLLFSGPYWRPSPGTAGIIIFSEDDFSAWWRTGDVGVPPLVLRHDLNGSIFIPGIRKKGDQRAYNSADEMIVPGPKVRLGSSAATEKLVKGDAYTGHEDTFLDALIVWIELVRLGIIAGGGGLDNTVFSAAINAFKNALPGDLSNVSKTD